MSFLQIDGILIDPSNHVDMKLNEASIDDMIVSFIDGVRKNIDGLTTEYQKRIEKYKTMLATSIGSDKVENLVKDSERAGERLLKSGALKEADGKDTRLYNEVNAIFKRNVIGQFKAIGNDDKNTQMAATAFAVVLITATLLSVILVGIVGMSAAMIIGAVFVAPILEEGGRRYLLQNAPNTERAVMAYTAYVNIYEFVTYVLSYAKAVGLIPIIVMRVVAALGHTFVASTQLAHHKRDVANGKAKENAGLVGYWLAVLYHFMWNGLSIMLGGAGMAAAGSIGYMIHYFN